MKLSYFERVLLSNQFKILCALCPEDADHYDNCREVVASGYELNYNWLFPDICDGSDVMSEDECREVLDILDMFRCIGDSRELVKLDSEVEDWSLKFMGFDGNNEAKQLRYVKFVVDREDKFAELRRGEGFNSHCPCLGRYREMLRIWREHGCPRLLSESRLIEMGKARA